MTGNTGEIHLGSEGELYEYINHHARDANKSKSKIKIMRTDTQYSSILDY